jgi:asparagine synthase (glutamine-hydrolysing)
MVEFSGWFHAPTDDAPPDAHGEMWWETPGTVLERPGQKLTLAGDGSWRSCVRRAPDGEVAVVHTGRVLNAGRLRADLRARGMTVSEDNDGDVLAAAFLAFGPDFAQRLEGGFAIALKDQRGRVHLIRDHWGSKPLYFYEHAEGVVFSTRVGRVLDHPAVEARMDEGAILLALNPRLLAPGETPITGLREVKRAHSAIFAGGVLSEERCYWRLEAVPHTDSESETAERVRALLAERVDTLLDLYPEPGLMLSGGLDSTAVAGLVAGRRRESGASGALKSYSLEFEGDETSFKPSPLRPEPDAPYARLAARELGTDHRSIRVTTRELLDALDEARDARGLPGWGQFDTSFLVLAQTIRDERSAVLTGSMADEVFGGYPWYYDDDVLTSGTFPWLGNAPRVWSSLHPDYLRRVDPGRLEQQRYQAQLDEVPRLASDSPQDARLREALHLGLQGPMAVGIDRGERMAAAVGLDTPSPYMNPDLLQYVWNVPWSLKSRPSNWKALLKSAVGDVVPRAVLERRKSGYPGTHDPAYAEQTMDALHAIATDSSAPMHQFMDPDQLKAFAAAADDTMTFSNAAHMLIPVVETNAWMERFEVTVR